LSELKGKDFLESGGERRGTRVADQNKTLGKRTTTPKRGGGKVLARPPTQKWDVLTGRKPITQRNFQKASWAKAFFQAELLKPYRMLI